MKIIWTDFASDNLKGIFEYHKEVASITIATTIRKNIFLATRQLLKNPESGQTELLLADFEDNYRYLVSGNYKLIYKIAENTIVITDIFDTRQNPININNPKRNKPGD